MRNLLLFTWNKILDHLVGSIIIMIFTSSIVLEVFTKIKLITQIVFPFLMWRWSGWIALIIVLITLWIRYKITKKQANKRQSVIRKPPKYYASYDRRVEEREFAGVIWRILVGSNTEPAKTELLRESVFAWPFPYAYCPQCDCELERKKTNWYCIICKKNYKIPKDLRKNTWEKVRRNYERLVVQWGYNNFGIAEDDHKPLGVILREMKKKKKEDLNKK